jgi:hypothetical protein
MDEETPTQPVEEATPPVAAPPTFRPSQPLPPHPAFAMVVKTRHSRLQWYGGTIILLLVVALFAVYGWQHGKVTTLTAQKLAADHAVDKLNNQLVPLEAAPKTTSTAGAGNQNVIKIPQLSIELTVPASLKTLTYTYETSDTGKVAKLSTSTLGALDTSCVENNAEDTGGNPALGTLFKGNGTGTNSSTTTVEKQYATYYIAYTPPQGSCANTTAINALLPAQLADFKASLSTIQPLP